MIFGHSKKGVEYRYLAKRRLLEQQQSFPGMDEGVELPFPTMGMRKRSYKIFGIVTNMDWACLQQAGRWRTDQLAS